MVPGASRSEVNVLGGCFYKVFKYSGCFRNVLYMVCGFRGFKEFPWYSGAVSGVRELAGAWSISVISSVVVVYCVWSVSGWIYMILSVV